MRISRSWTEIIESSGTYACTFNVSDRTKNYGKQLKKTIIVKDIEPPTFLGRSWTQSNFISDTNISINKSFNQNETIEYFVKAKDNAGINNIIIEIYNGSYANKSLNLYLSYSEYEIWKFTEKSDILGYCNITKIYINDTSGNIAKINLTDYYEIIELKLNSSLANETLLINTTQTFLASISGNASPVSEVIANITLPSGAIETITFSGENSSYTATYIPKKSGSYLVNITAILSSGISKTAHLNFSVPYGNISINSDEKIFLVENATYNLPIFIVPEKGDLVNVTVNISIENESIVNTTNKSAALEKIFWEDYYQGKAIYFPLYSAQIGSTTINITAFSPALNKSASKSINITVIQNDTSPPIINNFTNYEIVNLNEINKFVVNTSENETEIESVLLEITWPSNCTKNITATLKPNKLYELNFNGTNETGSYKFKIYSCNIAGICESTATKEFNVTNIYNVFAFILGAPVRLGHRYIKDDLISLNFLKNRTIKERFDRHVVLQNLDLLKLLGVKSSNIVEYPLQYFLEPQEIEKVSKMSAFREGASPIIGIHPGTSKLKGHINRRWPPENFAEFINLAHRQFPKSVVLVFGGDEDADAKKRIFELVDDKKRIFLMETPTIRDAAALIHKCDVFVSNDSGLMHLAASVKVPVVAIFGPTNPRWVFPWKVKHKIVSLNLPCSPCFYYSPRPLKCKAGLDFKCLKDLPPQLVMNAVKKILEQS